VSRRARRVPRVVATAVLVGLLALVARGHHILGVPHYAYDEAYPQAPVITYAVVAGPYAVKVTGYPGRPVPHELAEVHAYVHRADDEADVFSGPIAARIERDGLLGPEVSWGPSAARFEENLHKISPVFDEEGRYRIRLEMELEGQPYEIDFPIVVGDPTHPVADLFLWMGGLVLLVVVVRAVKIKLERRRALVPSRDPSATGA